MVARASGRRRAARAAPAGRRPAGRRARRGSAGRRRQGDPAGGDRADGEQERGHGERGGRTAAGQHHHPEQPGAGRPAGVLHPADQRVGRRQRRVRNALRGGRRHRRVGRGGGHRGDRRPRRPVPATATAGAAASSSQHPAAAPDRRRPGQHGAAGVAVGDRPGVAGQHRLRGITQRDHHRRPRARRGLLQHVQPDGRAPACAARACRRDARPAAGAADRTSARCAAKRAVGPWGGGPARSRQR